MTPELIEAIGTWIVLPLVVVIMAYFASRL
jgi:hypothetical protein